jgi:cysteine rich repeat protein
MNRFRTDIRPAVIGAQIVVFGLVAACFTSPAGARFNMAEARQACTPDVLRLCSNYLSNRGRIVSCLKHNARSLSPGCHSALSGGRR